MKIKNWTKFSESKSEMDFLNPTEDELESKAKMILYNADGSKRTYFEELDNGVVYYFGRPTETLRFKNYFDSCNCDCKIENYYNEDGKFGLLIKKK